MLIEPGSSGVASFTDDSSPDSRRTGGTKVSIHAQVLKDAPLEWFYKLLSFFPDAPGELKSARILAAFRNLPANVQQTVWAGISGVRVHITDPRPYRVSLERWLTRRLGLRNPTALFHQLGDSRNPSVTVFYRLFEESIAHRLILDSPVQRLARRILATEEFRLWSERTIPLIGSGDPPTSFRRIAASKRKALIRTIAETSSKSGSVFADALEVYNRPFTDDDLNRRYFDPRSFINEQVVRELLTTHAFDSGNQQSFDDIQQQRKDLLALATRRVNLWNSHVVKPLEIFDSMNSLFGQAADVAARFAASEFEERGLVAVTRRFRYVVFNGERMTQQDVAEKLRRWAELA